jgi:hypothetical protein
VKTYQLSLVLLSLFAQDLGIETVWRLQQDLTPVGTSLVVGLSKPTGVGGIFLSDGPRFSRVDSLANIPVLEITNNEQALEFVRIATSPALRGLIKSPLTCEILDRNSLTSSIFYGNQSSFLRARNSSEGYEGIIDHSTYIALKLRVNIKQTSDTFRVTRPALVQGLDGRYYMRWVEEEVDRRGRYALLTLREINARGRAIPWFFDNPL